MLPYAWHTLADYHHCDPSRLLDAAGLRETLVHAIAEAGGTYVTDVFHHFSPHGISGIVVIAESHVALHTWPEHHFAALDVFSCTAALDSPLILSHLGSFLRTTPRLVQTHARGNPQP